ncbi:phosphoenolpyruvate--protein phosphotransferase [Kytococcus sedentarius]|uniref:phosphoenolpyruvate--protein phosphotransferase n=1 Tax=Kytococcus sedentarius TaxID=1276 RepID=UPI0035BC950A
MPSAPAAATRPLTGTPVVPGVVHAPVVWARPRPEAPTSGPQLPEPERAGEAERLAAAIEAVAGRLEQRAAAVSGAAAEVLTATAGIARDTGWAKQARKKVQAGESAPVATTHAIGGFIETFEKLGGVMAERTTDLRDVRDRVIAELTGEPEPGVPTPAEPSVLCAEDLAPADTAGLDPQRVVAIVTSAGGPTSHTSIIARQHGIPCVVGVAGLEELPAGQAVLVDGGAGTVEAGIDADEAATRVAADADRRARIEAWSGPARTADGTDVELLANVQDGAGARAAAAGHAQGVGLFRTELLFLDARTEPTVADQATRYAEVFSAFAGRKVVLRTLDAGSDKPLAFATLPDEPNPALGVRGYRLVQVDPGLLERQLDAVAQAVTDAGVDAGDAWVMAPMVATLAEARTFARQVRGRGLRAGVMVEVPALALQAEALVREVDFVSIGTNDLAQYTMAADRMAASLADLTDPWQPAVLRLVEHAARAGADAGTPVGVCGEAAADPDLACVLVGMGVSSLSMAAGAVSAVGERLSRVTHARCRAAAEAVLTASDPLRAREAAQTALAS